MICNNVIAYVGLYSGVESLVLWWIDTGEEMQSYFSHNAHWDITISWNDCICITELCVFIWIGNLQSYLFYQTAQMRQNQPFISDKWGGFWVTALCLTWLFASPAVDAKTGNKDNWQEDNHADHRQQCSGVHNWRKQEHTFDGCIIGKGLSNVFMPRTPK